MEFPLSTLMQAIADILLPLTRIAAMFALMAGVGAKTVPVRVKMGLTVFFTLLIMPVIPPSKNIDLMSFNVVMLVMQQIMIGIGDGLYFPNVHQYIYPGRTNFGDANWFGVCFVS
ncbi:MAG: flagellar biosynthetic protein FliR [Rheinheimera sp.]|nr:flagellar biosynthetic protein FliR [Rheinheimera sp.]